MSYELSHEVTEELSRENVKWMYNIKSKHHLGIHPVVDLDKYKFLEIFISYAHYCQFACSPS